VVLHVSWRYWVDSFGDLLRARAVALGLVNERGSADSARLSAYLMDVRGIRACTKRAVESYFNGERAPRIGKMELILDALDVHGEDRLLAYRLAGRVESEGSDASAHEVSQVEDELTVQDFPTPLP
jgi:hypothetical protein